MTEKGMLGVKILYNILIHFKSLYFFKFLLVFYKDKTNFTGVLKIILITSLRKSY